VVFGSVACGRRHRSTMANQQSLTASLVENPSTHASSVGRWLVQLSVMQPAIASFRRSLRARRFRRWYVFALAAVVADSVAQRSNRYSQQVRGPGPVSPVRSQCLQNELALDSCELVPEQLPDTRAIDGREPKQRRRASGRTLYRYFGSVAWHQHLHYD
jgi:hypothetical protein